jgi:RNA polymerase I-specific transcription initiation factor RRN3
MISNVYFVAVAVAVAGMENPVEEANRKAAEGTARRGFLHRTISNVIQLAPTALFELFPVLADFFPHKRHPLSVQTEYVSQILQLCEAFPSLQQKVIDLILSRSLEMDVDIVIEESGEARINHEEEDEEEESGLFQLDDNGGGIPTPSRSRVASGQGGMQLGQLKIREDAIVVETADKLDAVLVLVLEYIRRCARKWGICGSEEGQTADGGRRVRGRTEDNNALWKKLFFQLVDAFEVRVMTTYKSKFVQFVLFHMCQLDPSLGKPVY